MPIRPCEPTQPLNYTGPKIDWWVTGAKTIADLNASMMLEGYGVLDRMSQTLPSLASGFVQVAPDVSSGITPNITYAGHTFGLLG